MHASSLSSAHFVGRLTTSSILLVALCGVAQAVDGTWTNGGGGNYNTPGNWQSNMVAGGSGATANFTLDANGEVVVTLDTNPTLGHLVFGDADPVGTPGIWTFLSGTGNTITLDHAAPTITVNTLGVILPDGFDDTFLNVDVAGTNGFTKLGLGILTLAGEPVAGNISITGGINVDEGTLRFAPAAVFTTDSFNQTKTLASGTTLESAVAVNNVSVAAGGTATYTYIGTGSGNASNMTGLGPGTTLDVNIENATTLSAGANWTGFETINVTGQTGTQSFFRLLANPTGGPAAFNLNSFATTELNLSNAQLLVRTNSGGNDINIATLNGTSTASLSGGNTGSIARYHIGASNDDMLFAGAIATGTGILLDKTGDGTMTFSGNLTYTTTNNANVNLRGGVTRITAGTLAVSGATSIPGGITDGLLGDLYTTIDVRAGATFDVSAASTTYSTASLQQIIGAGTIQGNYNHDQGRLRPGDAPAAANPNGNVTTPTAGTLTFDDNLGFAGTGQVMFDMTLNPLAGNDLIQVNGITTLTGTPTVTPNFLGGIPSSGTYTILNSAGGFSGSPAGWTVDWPGRGTPPTVVTSGNNLQFTAVPVTGGDLNWTGVNGGAWNVETTQNWHNNTTVAADTYFNGDEVEFADTYGPGNTAVSNFTVTLASGVTPASVTVDSTNNYSITGAGGIGGGASFTKRGSSTLILQTPNTFTGPASIEGGTVDIGAVNGALGSGSLTLANGNLLVANTATVALTNSALVAAGGTSNTITANGNAANPLTLPSLSGDGDLEITSEVTGKIVDIGANTGFTGNLSIGADGVLATGMVVRFNGNASGMPDTAVSLSNGATVRDRVTSAQTIALGSLSGDSTSFLGGFQGGSTSPQLKTWEIGALGTSTAFDGTITNGGGTSGGVDYFSATAITKVGPGTLTLTGNNNYAGVTTVNGGTLLVNGTHVSDTTPDPDFTVGDYVVNSGGTLGGTGTIGDGIDPVLVTVNDGGRLAPGASIGTLTVEGNMAFATGSIFDVEVTTSTRDLLAIMGDLDLTGMETLDVSVLSGGTPSGPHVIATYTGNLTGTFDFGTTGISIDYGTGTNSQITITVNEIIEGLLGDYNENDEVDAADYTVWRDTLTAGGTSLPNDPTPGVVDESDFLFWRAHFGETLGSGAGAGAAAVPEPASTLLAGLALVCALLGIPRANRGK